MYNCRLTDSLQTQCIYGPTAGIYLKLTYVMWLEITFHAQPSLKWMQVSIAEICDLLMTTGLRMPVFRHIVSPSKSLEPNSSRLALLSNYSAMH
ncbi:Acetyltransferase pyr8 [Fusarium oxysporum f. sp. albedinis]|nr:Acetyltransferase pyr8 [Fusarium oxysporum f. sp. albedinis]